MPKSQKFFKALSHLLYKYKSLYYFVMLQLQVVLFTFYSDIVKKIKN